MDIKDLIDDAEEGWGGKDQNFGRHLGEQYIAELQSTLFSTTTAEGEVETGFTEIPEKDMDAFWTTLIGLEQLAMYASKESAEFLSEVTQFPEEFGIVLTFDTFQIEKKGSATDVTHVITTLNIQAKVEGVIAVYDAKMSSDPMTYYVQVETRQGSKIIDVAEAIQEIEISPGIHVVVMKTCEFVQPVRGLSNVPRPIKRNPESFTDYVVKRAEEIGQL
jgi:hypothetical protein